MKSGGAAGAVEQRDERVDDGLPPPMRERPAVEFAHVESEDDPVRARALRDPDDLHTKLEERFRKFPEHRLPEWRVHLERHDDPAIVNEPNRRLSDELHFSHRQRI